MDKFTGKVAVITGAGSGIGRGIARALAKRGCHLVLADIREDKAAEVAADLASASVQTAAFACDISDRQQLEALADSAWQRFGQVDLVFCNAGVMPANSALLDAGEDAARWVFEVNYFGTRATAQIFGRRLVEQGSAAHLVITGSENSLCVPAPLMGDYNASKHAVHSLADVLRTELPDVIKVSLVCPGIVKTALPGTLALKPEAYGGPGEDPFGGDMPLGLDPDQVGEHVASEVAAGTFYILSHHCVRYMVAERYDELLAAFDAQTDAADGTDALDTRKLMAGMAPSG